MVELRLQLSYSALEAIVTGAEIEFQVDEDIVVRMRVDDDAFKLFQEQFQKHLLAHMPTDNKVH